MMSMDYICSMWEIPGPPHACSQPIYDSRERESVCVYYRSTCANTMASPRFGFVLGMGWDGLLADADWDGWRDADEDDFLCLCCFAVGSHQ